MAQSSGIALSLYLATRRVGGLARAQRNLRADFGDEQSNDTRVSERLGRSEVPRPKGPLIWIHVGSEAEAQAMPDLIDRLRDGGDSPAILMTTARYAPHDPLTARLPEDVIVQQAPYGYPATAEAFLQHWRPDVVLWADNKLDPALISCSHRAGIAMFLIDARVPKRPVWRWLPGIRRTLLRQFDYVLAGEKQYVKRLRPLGVPANRIEAVGFLQEGIAPLPCSHAERDSLGEVIATRPTWLAAGHSGLEVPMLVEAHAQAMRRSHRLLLVLAPQNPDDGAELATDLETDGWVVGLRSRDDEPEPDVEIFIVDLPDELGLWYRLSSISFMGGSLTPGTKHPVRNPFEAAALGSAVLSGPNHGIWHESFERLREAGAARTVNDTDGLARAVEQLLSPELVAEMAAAAWEVTTSGAEASDRIVELVNDALERKGW
ncbi:MAG: glycosyltransferase N-terminal domain-containing protein [Maritimibacter sp.]